MAMWKRGLATFVTEVARIQEAGRGKVERAAVHSLVN
ncbi:hypothetical protein BJY54_000089 [Streptomyces nodosus]|nr:hypothetical protein [Streptomyces nodosus]